MNPLYNLAIKRARHALSASYSTDLTQPNSDRILGRPVVESDDMPTTQTTTVLDNEIVFGDFSNYVVVDKPGSTSVEYIPHLFNTANNLPDGRAWPGTCTVPFRRDASNILAFRLLQDNGAAGLCREPAALFPAPLHSTKGDTPMSDTFRVRPASEGGPCAVYVPELGGHVVPNPAETYAEDHPLVQAARWMFVTDAEMAARGQQPPVTSVPIPPIEDNSARPGSRRSTRR
jgi:hypothetical protein